MRTALLYGTSGLVGSSLLKQLLYSSDYKKIIAVNRKALNIEHDKLEVVIADYSSIESKAGELIADDVYIALGSRDKNLEKNYSVLAAKVARLNGAQSIAVVTAIGANPKGLLSFIKVKGEIEHEIIALKFGYTNIFRPSLITGREKSTCIEKLFLKIWKIIDPLMIAGFKKYKAMSGDQIAKAMYLAIRHPCGQVRIFNWPEMEQILKKYAHKL